MPGDANAKSNPALNLVWIDLEMTGLDTTADQIIEIATIVTDNLLNEVAEGPVFAVHQPKSVLDAMDAWNTRQHRESGLVERVLASDVSVAQAEEQTLEFLRQACRCGRVTDVRQQYLPGSPLYGAPDADTGSFFSLSKSRRQYAQTAGPTLGAGSRRRLSRRNLLIGRSPTYATRLRSCATIAPRCWTRQFWRKTVDLPAIVGGL
jgi:hypothetical protein